jgi:hypothetical protein
VPGVIAKRPSAVVTVVIPGRSRETTAPGSGAPVGLTTMPRIVGRGWGAAPRAVDARADRESARRKRDRFAMRIVENPLLRSARRTATTAVLRRQCSSETRYGSAKGSEMF